MFDQSNLEANNYHEIVDIFFGLSDYENLDRLVEFRQLSQQVVKLESCL